MVPGRRYNVSYLVRLLKRHYLMLAVPFVLFTSCAALLARALPDVFYSQATVQIVPRRVPESYVRSTINVPIGERLRSAREQLVKGPYLSSIIDEFGLYGNSRTLPRELLIEWTRRSIRIDLVKADAFVVGFYGYVPDQVVKVAERLATVFIEQSLRDREMLADSTSEFLDAELQQARDRLVEQESKVEEFRRRFAGELPSQLQTNLEMLQSANVQLQNVTAALNRDRDRRSLLQKAAVDMEAAATKPPAETTDSPADAADRLDIPPGPASVRLQMARDALARLELRLTPRHPDIAEAKSIIERLERAAASGGIVAVGPGLDLQRRQADAALKELDGQIAAQREQEQRLLGAIATYRARIEAVPSRESDWTRLTRDYATSQQIYTALLAKKEESKIAANLERRGVSEQFRITDPPARPGRPSSPDRARLVFVGCLMGLALGCGLVLLSELRDSGLRGESEIAETLGLPVLAILPVIVMPAERHHTRMRRMIGSAAAALVVTFIAWRLR